MVNAFHMDIEVVVVQPGRYDGLAMSSRNKNLTKVKTKSAKVFELLSRGNDSEISDELKMHGFGVDYVVSRKDRRFGAGSLAPMKIKFVQ